MPFAYGWKRDLPDFRDHSIQLPPRLTQALPPVVDLRPQCPPVYDQGNLGSCTANAIAGAIQFDQIKQQLPTYAPSRLFIYYNERVIEDSVLYDAGAELRDGMKAIGSCGYCPEPLWTYETNRFAIKPPSVCYQEAAPNSTIAYARLDQTPEQLKGALAATFPFVFGFTVYESFESDAVAKTGNALMPLAHEGVLGGHAVVCVGYDDTKQVFICRNSWGEKWGDKGYFYLPYQYLLDPNLSADLWSVQHVVG